MERAMGMKCFDFCQFLSLMHEHSSPGCAKRAEKTIFVYLKRLGLETNIKTN
jgi:hypothetical protein